MSVYFEDGFVHQYKAFYIAFLFLHPQCMHFSLIQFSLV